MTHQDDPPPHTRNPWSTDDDLEPSLSQNPPSRAETDSQGSPPQTDPRAPFPWATPQPDAPSPPPWATPQSPAPTNPFATEWARDAWTTEPALAQPSDPPTTDNPQTGPAENPSPGGNIAPGEPHPAKTKRPSKGTGSRKPTSRPTKASPSTSPDPAGDRPSSGERPNTSPAENTPPAGIALPGGNIAPGESHPAKTKRASKGTGSRKSKNRPTKASPIASPGPAGDRPSSGERPNTSPAEDAPPTGNAPAGEDALPAGNAPPAEDVLPGGKTPPGEAHPAKIKRSSKTTGGRKPTSRPTKVPPPTSQGPVGDTTSSGERPYASPGENTSLGEARPAKSKRPFKGTGGRRSKNRSAKALPPTSQGPVGDASFSGERLDSGAGASASADASGGRGARSFGEGGGGSGDVEGRAREICLRLLGMGPRTWAQLAEALRRKGIPDEVVERVLGRFTDVGLIDDEAFAQAWVQSRHAGRGLARRALAGELRRRGVAEETVRDAVERLDEEEEERTARRLVERKAAATRGVEPAKRMRRLVGVLARKGYPPGMAYRIVREVLEEEGAEVEDLPAETD
jgi:regulatory protein